MDYRALTKHLAGKLRPYGPALIVLLLGVLLMVIPTGGKPEPLPAPEPAAQPDRDLAGQLEEILCQMEGAGRVKVLLTEARGERTLYQEDVRRTGGEDTDSQTVILGGSQPRPIPTQVLSPVYQGAVILCQGADSSFVRLSITQAVSRATGLGANQITVLKLK